MATPLMTAEHPPVIDSAPRRLRWWSFLLPCMFACGAIAWSVAGAGIYGSPFDDMHEGEAINIAALLIAGPLMWLPGLLVALWRPAWGAALLLVASLATCVLACGVFYSWTIVPTTDEFGIAPTTRWQLSGVRPLDAALVAAPFAIPMLLSSVAAWRRAPRRHQFSLAFAGWCVLLLAVAIAGCRHATRPRRHVKVRGPHWGTLYLAIDTLHRHADRVRAVELAGPAFGDEDIEYLQGLNGLESLSIAGSRIGAPGLRRLAELSNQGEIGPVQEIMLSLQPVLDDQAVEALAELDSLRTLFGAGQLPPRQQQILQTSRPDVAWSP